jgi:C4-dicarboxylate transporter DctM subunit
VDASLVITSVLALMFILMLLGSPIFVSLGLSGIVGIYLTMGHRGLFQLPASMFEQLDSFILVAIPLFILMGELICITGVAEDIYDGFSKWLNRIPGGLAIASIYSCALFGAISGVSIAGVATIGTMAVPEMLKRGYAKSISAGCIAAAGGLAVLIPPSISFILYGAMSGVSVGKLFIGGILPGLVLATLMALYVFIRVLRNPSLAPREFARVTMRQRLATLKGLWPVMALIVLVLGGIYSGITTPTEAGAIGVAGALLVAAIRGRLNCQTFVSALSKATHVSVAILIILAAAYTFSQFLNVVRIPEIVAVWLSGLGLPGWVIMSIIMLSLIALGCFIDGASLIIVTTPILLPTITALGFDPLWYGILLVLNIEIAVITPPVGLNLYALKSCLGDTLSLEEIIKGTTPFILVDVVCLLLFMSAPWLALWLPGRM